MKACRTTTLESKDDKASPYFRSFWTGNASDRYLWGLYYRFGL